METGHRAECTLPDGREPALQAACMRTVMNHGVLLCVAEANGCTLNCMRVGPTLTIRPMLATQTPITFKSKHFRFDKFIGKQCALGKTFGIPTDIVLYE